MSKTIAFVLVAWVLFGGLVYINFRYLLPWAKQLEADDDPR